MWGELLNKAARLAQGPDPAAAHGVIARLLEERPSDGNALTLAGIVAQRTGDNEGAIVSFSRAVSSDPGNPAYHQNLGVALKRQGRFEAACASFDAALQLRPGHPATLANLGSCLIESGRAKEAVNVLSQAGDHADALANLGIALGELGRTDDAIASYRHSLAQRPGHVDTMINLSDALTHIGQIAEAEGLLAAIVRDHPQHPRAANQLALLQEKRGDFDKALAILRPAFDADGLNHVLGVNLARTLIRADTAQEAVAICDRLMAARPGMTTPLALKIAALTRLKDAEERTRLMALDRFVTIHDIDAVPGYADMNSFNRALVAELAAHPSLTFEPEGLVTKKGRQSDDLVQDRMGAIGALVGLVTQRLTQERDRLAALPRDHPFLEAVPDKWSVTMWGTILRAGGEVAPHIHAPNWLSGVYYPGFPFDTEGDEGAFGIGMIPSELGGGGDVTVIRPRPGRMILFPSFLWHATLAFGGNSERISFAFDLVPEGVGRPHRLK